MSGEQMSVRSESTRGIKLEKLHFCDNYSVSAFCQMWWLYVLFLLKMLKIFVNVAKDLKMQKVHKDLEEFLLKKKIKNV